MSLKSRVEAVLFLTDKPVVAAVVAKLVNEDVQLVRQAIMQLIYDYEQRDCALEISDDDDGYMMQVKDQFANLANDLAPIDLPVSIVRTLSAIAIKQPVLQSEIVRIRGAGAYEHITTLLEKELITKKEEGRSHILSTTKKFQEYFRLSQDAKALRTQLKDQDKEEKLGELDHQLELPLDNELLPIGTEIVTERVEAALVDDILNSLGQETPIEEEPVQSQVSQNILAQDEVAQSQSIESRRADDELAPDQSTQIEPTQNEPVQNQLDQSELAENGPAASEQVTDEAPKTKKDIATSIADWSDSSSESTVMNPAPKSKRTNKNSKTANNMSVTNTRFMAAPTTN